MSYEAKDLKRFWDKVSVSSDDDCWIWIACIDKDGYGQIRWNKTGRHYAHQVSYMIANGEYNKSLCVLHSCDNPSCVNPRHLSLGTHQDNSNDRVSRKRQAFGERIGVSRVTDDEVVEIAKLYADGIQESEIASIKNLGLSTISSILTGKRWKHIPRPIFYKGSEIGRIPDVAIE